MGDKLEKFINQHQGAFDAEAPSEGLWDRIEQDLPEDQKNSWWSYWKVAAMLFLVSTIVLMVDRIDQPDQQLSVATTLSVEFVEAEQFYSQLIAERKEQIGAYDIQGDLHREFLDDINELHDLYLELKSTFEIKSGDQKLVDAMISNLQLRMRVLDRQIEILERINDYHDEEAASI
ncbi:MAG: hypothetical protein R8G66_12740 [Cytophagales bacterium]|nr:hypothetical protein [Cytophagales bacterium]